MQTKINKTEFFYAIKLIQKRFFFSQKLQYCRFAGTYQAKYLMHGFR